LALFIDGVFVLFAGGPRNGGTVFMLNIDDVVSIGKEIKFFVCSFDPAPIFVILSHIIPVHVVSERMPHNNNNKIGYFLLPFCIERIRFQNNCNYIA
jgi:hypothetical protein